MKKTFIFSLLVVGSAAVVWGQRPEVAARLGYPQWIIHNAKIVTVDDPSPRSNPGTIVQAMAIRDGKILATGTSAEITSLAGPETKRIDVKGRTIVPSFASTHEHPLEWAFVEPEAIRHALPVNNDFLIALWPKLAPVEDQFREFAKAFPEAVANAKPGQWIMWNFQYGPDYEYEEELGRVFYRRITKEYLDRLAPNNPVKVGVGFVEDVLNSKAQGEFRKVYPKPGWGTIDPGPSLPEIIQKFERTGRGRLASVDSDVIFQGRTALLAEILKAELEVWASYGFTLVASSPYATHNFQALSYLDRKGEMPMRFAWGYSGPDFDGDILRYVAGLLGHGTDYIWNVGAWGAVGKGCTTVKPKVEVAESGFQENCSFSPGRVEREVLEGIVKSGGRIGTMHTRGDKDVDYLLEVIEQASKEAGLTLEDIRSKRHAYDHGSGSPRPDQIPRIKNLGMILSQRATNMWGMGELDDFLQQSGIEYAAWSSPRKSVTEAGIMNTFEIDQPRPFKVFPAVLAGMTRMGAENEFLKGKVLGAGERTDRIIQLKALTTWAAYYVLRENLLGSLERGKFADFLVLDRDYMTIPEDDIPNIRVLMTVVGGKAVHLLPSLAREIGMQPAGPVTWKGQTLPYLVEAAKQ